MGYTHYMRQQRSFTEIEWNQLTGVVRSLIQASDPHIGGWEGTGGVPAIDSTRISFNGIGGQSYENFDINRELGGFNFSFCKTAGRNYDQTVAAILIYINKTWGDEIIIVTSDGDIFADRSEPDPRNERTPAWKLLDQCEIFGERPAPEPLTTTQAQRYLDNRGEGCPACESSAIEGESYDLDNGTIYQPMCCTDCGLDWVDAYELHRIADIDGHLLDAQWTGEAAVPVNQLSEAALRMLGMASRGASDHRDGLMRAEESLTFNEFAECESFISWLEESNRTFGHNLPTVYAEYRESLS